MLFKRPKHRLMRSVILSLLLYNSSLQPIAPLYAKGIMTVIASVGVLTTLFQQWFIAMFWGYQLKQAIEKEGFTLPELTLKEKLEGLCTLKCSLKEYAIQDPVALFDAIKKILKELEIQDPLKFFKEKAKQIEALLHELEIHLPVDQNAHPLETAKKIQHELGIQNPVAFLKDHIAIIKAGCAMLDNPQKYAALKEKLRAVKDGLTILNTPEAIKEVIDIPIESLRLKTTELLLTFRAKKQAAELEAEAQRTKEQDQELLQCYELLLKESDKQRALLQQEEEEAQEKIAAAHKQKIEADAKTKLQLAASDVKKQVAQEDGWLLQTIRELFFLSPHNTTAPQPLGNQAVPIAPAEKKQQEDWQQQLRTAFHNGFFEEDQKTNNGTAHINRAQHTIDPHKHRIELQTITRIQCPAHAPSAGSQPNAPAPTPLICLPALHQQPPLRPSPLQRCRMLSSSPTPPGRSTTLITAH